MKKPLRLVLVAGAVVVAAVVLNPSAERHRQAVRDAVADRSPLAGALGGGRLVAFFSSYRSIGVASYTLLDRQVLTVGAFGWVHVRHVGP